MLYTEAAFQILHLLNAISPDEAFESSLRCAWLDFTRWQHEVGKCPVTGTLCIEIIAYQLISSAMEIQSFDDEKQTKAHYLDTGAAVK